MKKYLFIMFAIVWAVSGWMKDQLPERPGAVAGLMNDPIQTPARVKPFMTQVGGERYEITPRYDYEQWGMVVSYHHSDSWMDRVHEKWADNLNIKDLCVIWGAANMDPSIYKNVEFSSGQWTCYTWIDDPVVYNRFDGVRLANNHMLADDPEIAEAILDSNYGDIVHIKGYLSNYRGRKITRGTSITRTDTGNGACETIYVTDFSIIHDANKDWDMLYRWSSYLLLALISWVLFFGSLPILRDLLRRE
ncbi:hypothetical protein [Endozoicomonas elysicola]|uniref:hypothetical protein n=1 Tax=Endozoicomonas elysicola TaxID=305900 RepID=UPI0003631345|nr:hypothetical protein [Endozoicomonas elysicola]